jgi:hypothetical protein
MESELLANLDRLDITVLGIERFNKNLSLNISDVVDWCREKTKTADRIIRKGKNFYVYVDNVILTINASSYTIITAHREKTRV